MSRNQFQGLGCIFWLTLCDGNEGKKIVCRADRLLLVKCYDNNKVKSPYNWVISSLTQPQVANQQKKREKTFTNSKIQINKNWLTLIPLLNYFFGTRNTKFLNERKNIKIYYTRIRPKHGSSDVRAGDLRSKGPGFNPPWIQWDFASKYTAYLFCK